MGDFFRDLLHCRIDLSRLEEQGSSSARKMRELLEVRSEKLFSSTAYAAALIFDPRFNNEDSVAITDAQRESGIVSTPFGIISNLNRNVILYKLPYQRKIIAISDIFGPEIQPIGAYSAWSISDHR